MTPHYIYIGIGTNLPQAGEVLRWTHSHLAETLRGSARYSTPRLTEPVDFPFPAPFTNQLAFVETTLPIREVRSLLKQLERQLGRTPEDTARGIVRLDLDLLWADGHVIKAADWERDYVRSAREELELGKTGD